jgi:UDP-N-acetylmuramyl pentapeptide phosphotransferase/UDP-N-acetylglucosamine-1-phosphate transferase
MELDNIIFVFVFSIFFNYFLIKNYKLFFLKEIADTEFNKPQAFHKFPAIRSGGITILISLLLFLIFYRNQNNYFFSTIALSVLFFIIGFLEDIKIHTKPHIRLFYLFIVSFLIIYYFNIQILNTQVAFLNNIIFSNKFFSIIFVCFCLLFVTNGCNFIDGFNGLLILHTIIILGILYFINNSNSNNIEIHNIILFFISIFISIFYFNFPKAKIFLGDSGAYITGTILSITTIQISNLNQKITPFFFACLLFYIFFEVIFSFFRKVFTEKKSPFKPDKKHLHMLIFIYLNKNIKNPLKANFLTSLFINITYLIIIFPTLFFYDQENFCKTYFSLLVIFYLLIYFFLEKKNLKKR